MVADESMTFVFTATANSTAATAFTPVAQLAEQPSPKRQVAGSIPARRVR